MASKTILNNPRVSLLSIWSISNPPPNQKHLRLGMGDILIHTTFSPFFLSWLSPTPRVTPALITKHDPHLATSNGNQGRWQWTNKLSPLGYGHCPWPNSSSAPGPFFHHGTCTISAVGPILQMLVDTQMAMGIMGHVTLKDIFCWQAHVPTGGFLK